MFSKMFTCLFKPREIARYFNEKMYKSILLILVLTLISIIPYTISISVDSHLSGDAYSVVLNNIQENISQTDLEIKDHKLSGSKGIMIEGYSSIIVFNVLEGTKISDEIYKMSFSYNTVPLVIFDTQKVEVYFWGIKVYESDYETLEFNDFSMAKVLKNNYLEMDKLFNALDQIHVKLTVKRVAYNSIMLYISRIISAFFLALLVTFLAKMLYYYIPFKIRYKVSLDSQMIAILFSMLYYMTSFTILIYAGEVLSFVFAVMALKKIVPLKIEIKGDEENDN